MIRNRRLGSLILWLICGAVIGSLFGELLGLVLPEGVVKDFFLTSTDIGIGPVPINLAVVSFTFGFTFDINVTGVLGILFAAYYFRWFR
ncbi:DUF4321 domain-containing protein [Candidatus Zixiibacteriota bacterium]